MLYDLPLHGQMLEPFFKSRSGSGAVIVYLLYSEADRKRNDLLLDLALPSRAALAEIYRAWSEAAAGGEADFPGKLRERFDPPAGKRFWERSLKIFTEAGLASGGAPLPPPERAAPEQLFDGSPLFRAAHQRREDCLRYQEHLLEGAPGELAACWNELLER